MNGYASQIIVELDKSREGLRITDNGRGIPHRQASQTQEVRTGNNYDHVACRWKI